MSLSLKIHIMWKIHTGMNQYWTLHWNHSISVRGNRSFYVFSCKKVSKTQLGSIRGRNGHLKPKWNPSGTLCSCLPVLLLKHDPAVMHVRIGEHMSTRRQPGWYVHTCQEASTSVARRRQSLTLSHKHFKTVLDLDSRAAGQPSWVSARRTRLTPAWSLFKSGTCWTFDSSLIQYLVFLQTLLFIFNQPSKLHLKAHKPSLSLSCHTNKNMLQIKRKTAWAERLWALTKAQVMPRCQKCRGTVLAKTIESKNGCCCCFFFI